MTLAGMPSGYCAATPTVQAQIGERMPDIRPGLPSAPAPWQETRKADGTLLRYDGEGRLAGVWRSDGTTISYKAGIPVSLTRPDGSVKNLNTEHPDGREIEAAAKGGGLRLWR